MKNFLRSGMIPVIPLAITSLVLLTATVIFTQQSSQFKSNAGQKHSTWTGTLTKLSECINLGGKATKAPSLPTSVPKIKNDANLPPLSAPQICYQLISTNDGQNHYLLFPMLPALTNLPQVPSYNDNLIPKPSLPSGAPESSPRGPLTGGPAPSLPTNLPRPPSTLQGPETQPNVQPNNGESDFGKPVPPSSSNPDSYVGKKVTVSGVELNLKPTFILVLSVSQS